MPRNPRSPLPRDPRLPLSRPVGERKHQRLRELQAKIAALQARKNELLVDERRIAGELRNLRELMPRFPEHRQALASNEIRNLTVALNGIQNERRLTQREMNAAAREMRYLSLP
jgi:hypothetical protein